MKSIPGVWKFAGKSINFNEKTTEPKKSFRNKNKIANIMKIETAIGL